MGDRPCSWMCPLLEGHGTCPGHQLAQFSQDCPSSSTQSSMSQDTAGWSPLTPARTEPPEDSVVCRPHALDRQLQTGPPVAAVFLLCVGTSRCEFSEESHVWPWTTLTQGCCGHALSRAGGEAPT